MEGDEHLEKDGQEMTVYVDQLFSTKRTLKWPYLQACHMVADTEEELISLAKKIGLKREWIQKPGNVEAHFDLTPSKRSRALSEGAKEFKSVRDFGEWLRAKRFSENQDGHD